MVALQTAIASKIRTARRQRGWTQASLSHFTGLGSGDISRIETGRLIPTDSQLRRLAKALDIELLEDGQAVTQ
jgi:ribosome-binding protein aMBF1 (putative translation factor)